MVLARFIYIYMVWIKVSAGARVCLHVLLGLYSRWSSVCTRLLVYHKLVEHCWWNVCVLGTVKPRFHGVLLDCLPTAMVEKKTGAFSCVNGRVKGTSPLSIIIESLVFFCMKEAIKEDRDRTDCVL